jgi:heat shock protein HslJ
MSKLRATIASLAALVLAGNLAATAMAEDEPMPTDTPEGITWILQQQAVDGPTVVEHLPRLVLASLVMEDGQAGGQSGCNSWFASYELDGTALTFGMPGSTMMACPAPQTAVETAFLSNIGSVASWASDGANLTLYDAEGNGIMLFAPAPEATVVGSWVATGINNGMGAVETNELTSTVTAVFDEEGMLSGVDGCNNYFTSYEVDGDAITIAPEIATTMMACEGPAAELSAQYFAALTAATTWSIDAAGNLELRDADGAKQVGYAPAG